GYFLSRNIWFLFERMEGKLLPITLFLMTCFFLVNPIWQINGFRMWTAVHVFLYGLLPYLFDGKKRGLWISVLSILVHFSMLVPVGVLAGYMLLGNRLNIFFIFFLLTFFVSEIDISAVNTFMENYAPEILQERTDSYRSETVIEADASEPETRNWYIVWHRRALGWSVTGFLVLLFWKGRRFFKENNGWACLFSFTLLFYGVANLLSHLPSGGRFTVIGELCALALIILYIQNRPMEKMMKRFVYLAGPALMLFLIVSIRVGFLYSSVASILGNSIVALFISGEFVSLNNILKSIL
ncbi:MAG TPA: EpsG family protein, partial [Sphingobacterium sp.]|nr:EpsG family protein [Sphingobacterium sp.]